QALQRHQGLTLKRESPPEAEVQLCRVWTLQRDGLQDLFRARSVVGTHAPTPNAHHQVQILGCQLERLLVLRQGLCPLARLLKDQPSLKGKTGKLSIERFHLAQRLKRLVKSLQLSKTNRRLKQRAGVCRLQSLGLGESSQGLLVAPLGQG